MGEAAGFQAPFPSHCLPGAAAVSEGMVNSRTLFAGVKGKSGVTFKAVASTKTRKGKYAFNRRLPKKVTYLFVERPPTSVACAVPLVTCTSSIVSNAISGVVRVAPPPKRRR